MKSILETTYAGMTLKNPVIIGSSGLTRSAERNRNLEKAGAGAIVLKSLFEEQISMESHWMSQSSDFPEAIDYINNYVKNNRLDDYVTLIKESKQLCSIPIIASINCYKSEGWIDFARKIEEAGADALELNIVLLPTDPECKPEDTEELYIKILRLVKQTVKIPVIVKMSKFFDNIVRMVDLFYKNGAAAVVLFNRLYQPDIDINKLQIVSGQVFSSHSDIADTIRWTGIVAGKFPRLSLASSTGIHDWEDLIKCILSGASAVQLCSAVYQHGLEIISPIIISLEEWMNSMNFRSIEEFKGKLSTANIIDPSLYERSQFMKYFSNRD
jgi:Dihydroorotate dehydrogenase